MPPSEPRLDSQQTPQGQVHLVLGAWTAADLTSPPVWKAVTAQLKGLKVNASIPWDLSGIDKLDFLGAQVLWNHWGRQWPAQLTIEPNQRALLASVEKFTIDLPARARPGWLAPIAVLGRRLLSAWDHARGLVRLVGQLLLCFLIPLRGLLHLLRHLGRLLLAHPHLLQFVFDVLLHFRILAGLLQLLRQLLHVLGGFVFLLSTRRRI